MAKKKIKSVANLVEKFVSQKTKELSKALSYLKEDEGIKLGEDTFLVGEAQDGSDKCYGFLKRDGEILIRTRNASSGYGIEAMDYEDLEYMFNLSQVFNKIKAKKYPIVNADEI